MSDWGTQCDWGKHNSPRVVVRVLSDAESDAFKGCFKAIKHLFDRHDAPYDDDLLNERERTHGDFAQRAEVADDLLSVLHDAPGWDYLQPFQRQALTEVMGKVSRILAGDHDFIDHWQDCRGYFDLATEALKRNAN